MAPTDSPTRHNNQDAKSPAGYPPSSGGAAPQRMALSFRCGAASQSTDVPAHRHLPELACQPPNSLVLAATALVWHRQMIIPTLLARFRHSTSSRRTPEHPRGPARTQAAGSSRDYLVDVCHPEVIPESEREY
jgi:hypothetical protein